MHFASYEAAKSGLMEISPGSVNNEGWVVHSTVGAVARALATAVTTPLAVVKTQLQRQVNTAASTLASLLFPDVLNAFAYSALILNIVNRGNITYILINCLKL